MFESLLVLKNTEVVTVENSIINIEVVDATVVNTGTSTPSSLIVNGLKAVKSPTSDDLVIGVDAAGSSYVNIASLQELKDIGLGDFELKWEMYFDAFHPYHTVFGLTTTNNNRGILMRHTVRSQTYGLQFGWNFSEQSNWNHLYTSSGSTADESMLKRWIKFVLRRVNGVITMTMDGQPLIFGEGGMPQHSTTVANTVDLNTVNGIFLAGGTDTESYGIYYKYFKINKLTND